MADPVDAILQDFQAAVDRATALAMDRLRAIVSAAPAVADDEVGDHQLKLISIGAAGLYADLTDDRIRQMCRQHLYGSSPDGFGYKRGGRWQVVEDRFKDYLGSPPMSPRETTESNQDEDG